MIDSTEQMRVRMEGNVERMEQEITEDLRVWWEEEGDRGEIEFPTDWEGVKRAGRRAALAAQGVVSKTGGPAMLELSALEMDVLATLWDLGEGTAEEVYRKATERHRASYRDMAEAMEELAVRRKILQEEGGGIYAPIAEQEEVIRFLVQEYIETDAEDSLSRSDLLRRIQRVLN
jgi:predicted transcriptional regulator